MYAQIKTPVRSCDITRTSIARNAPPHKFITYLVLDSVLIAQCKLFHHCPSFCKLCIQLRNPVWGHGSQLNALGSKEWMASLCSLFQFSGWNLESQQQSPPLSQTSVLVPAFMFQLRWPRVHLCNKGSFQSIGFLRRERGFSGEPWAFLSNRSGKRMT